MQKKWHHSHRRQLIMALSTHVDDLKGAANKETAMSLLKHLEQRFGPCKAEWKEFVHTGVQHVQTPGRVYCHQHAYTAQLRQMDLTRVVKADPNNLVDEEMKASFDSLLGGVAWVVITRGDVAVYVQALQRRGSAPRVLDCRRINLVVRYLQRHKTVSSMRRWRVR